MGIIVIFSVGAITFFKESRADMVATTIDTTTSSTTSNNNAQNPANVPSLSTRSDDDNVNDDENSENTKTITAITPPNPTTNPVKIIPVSTPAIVPKQTASVYTDGTYTATGSYMSPGGEDQISITLTLAKDIISSVSATPAAGDRTSQRYQNAFISGYKQYVVGKNIADVNLTRVSGSSLTPMGFNDALTQIKAQAKA